MNKHSDTIIINGQHFNARTGKAVTYKRSNSPNVRNVDGILPQHISGAVLHGPAQYTEPLRSVVSKPIMDVTRVGDQSVPKRALQPGKTLMRRATAKPSPSLKRHTKISTIASKANTVAASAITTKISAAAIDARKLQHAQGIEKSTLVSRFSEETIVRTKPARLTASASHAIVAGQQAIHGLAKQPSLDLFERALAKASSHEQSTPPHVKRALKKAAKTKRHLNMAATALACLLLIGFIGYQNVASVKFQYASSRAGFHAALPGYKPAGFSVGKLSYQAGTVSVKFHSNSDDRSFAITQKPSVWDSQTLRDNVVATSGKQYHTAEAGGRTIFLYDDKATWVNSGIWYQVSNTGSLTERQVTELASSM
ncbi:hypothetical protein H7Y63_04220 [Polaromonas sp.]|nr:hypothetical protein [Candidatus Saccharibacteria bacterium]